jgi:hypothetical protein
MKGSEGKKKMDDSFMLELLSTLKVFARNHMKRAYLEFIDTLPFFYAAKAVGTFQEFP